MPTPDDIRLIAPGLEKSAQGAIADLWTRPGLSLRDRSIVTLAALIARSQTIEMAYQFGLALDNGVKPLEISEIITHLAFYSGWGSAIAAIPAAKEVFAQRKVGTDQLSPASEPQLPLDAAAEAQRVARVDQQFGTVAPGLVQDTTDVLFRDLWLRPGLAPRDRSLVTVSALIAGGPGCAAIRSPQPGNGQRPDAGRGRRGHPATSLLRRLAERLLGAARRQGRLRQASQMKECEREYVFRGQSGARDGCGFRHRSGDRQSLR